MIIQPKKENHITLHKRRNKKMACDKKRDIKKSKDVIYIPQHPSK